MAFDRPFPSRHPYGVATMISEVYDALREAGASEDKSRKAAEAVAAYNSRFASIDL